MYPKISIVTASYNQANYLEQTIKSIVEQNYPNLEYIIIDGGSTDGSLDIIKKYEQCIYYWVSEKDKGVCDAINKGFKVSTGEIMGCLNSDDMLHRNSLFTLAEIFSDFKEVNWLVGSNVIYDDLGRTVSVTQTPAHSIYKYFEGSRDFIQLESCYWTRGLWNEAGGYFNENLKYASDFDLWVRFFKRAKIYTVDTLIGGFRYRKGNQLSINFRDLYLQEVDAVLASEIFDDQILNQFSYFKKLERRWFYWGRFINLFIRNKSTPYLLTKNKLFNKRNMVYFDIVSQKYYLDNTL